MAYDAVKWANRQSQLPPTLFIILQNLACHRNYRTKLCCPCQKLIARECRDISIATLQRALVTLETLGLVSRITATVDGRSGTAYILHLANDFRLPPGRNWRQFMALRKTHKPRPGEARRDYGDRLLRLLATESARTEHETGHARAPAAGDWRSGQTEGKHPSPTPAPSQPPSREP